MKFSVLSFVLLLSGCYSYKPIEAPTSYKFIENKIFYDHGYYREYFLNSEGVKLHGNFKKWHGTFLNPYLIMKTQIPLNARSAPRGGSYNTLKPKISERKAE